MEISRVRLPKQKLAALSVEERTALLLMGHAVNEINVLHGLMMSLHVKDTTSYIVQVVEAGRLHILLRVLIGKLHEAWELFKQRIQANEKMRSNYLHPLSGDAKQALENLNKHFGKKSPLTIIRNKLSFHYKDEDELVERNFQRLPEGRLWEFYLGKTFDNSFYYASELVVLGSAIKLANSDQSGDEVADYNALFDITLAVCIDVLRLFEVLIYKILRVIPDLKVDKVDIGDVPGLSDFSFDFFFDADKPT